MSAQWVRRDGNGGYFHIQEFDVILIILAFSIAGFAASFLIGRAMVLAPNQRCIQEVKQVERFARRTAVISRELGTMYHDYETALPVCTRTIGGRS